MVKKRGLWFVAALGIGLAVPFLQLWLKIVLFMSVLLMDAAMSDEKKIKYSISIFFFLGVILSYLYKFIYE